MLLPLTLFIIGIVGFMLHRTHALLLLLALELMLLAVTFMALLAAYDYEVATGQAYGVFIISIAGAESAIGLSILVAYYRLRGTISLSASHLPINRSSTLPRFCRGWSTWSNHGIPRCRCYRYWLHHDWMPA